MKDAAVWVVFFVLLMHLGAVLRVEGGTRSSAPSRKGGEEGPLNQFNPEDQHDSHNALVTPLRALRGARWRIHGHKVYNPPEQKNVSYSPGVLPPPPTPPAKGPQGEGPRPKSTENQKI